MLNSSDENVYFINYFYVLYFKILSSYKVLLSISNKKAATHTTHSIIFPALLHYISLHKLHDVTYLNVLQGCNIILIAHNLGFIHIFSIIQFTNRTALSTPLICLKSKVLCTPNSVQKTTSRRHGEAQVKDVSQTHVRLDNHSLQVHLELAVTFIHG